jgi:DNA-binding SARP family transcriptional activator
VAASELQLETRLALGLHAEVVPELEALVREHPLRETLIRLLMLALYRGGRQADALAVYQDARRALVGGLGLEPGHALQQLERAILRQDAALLEPGTRRRRGRRSHGLRRATRAAARSTSPTRWSAPARSTSSTSRAPSRTSS